MSYSKKDILTSLSLMIFIISFAIVFTVFFKYLYYSDIYRLGIDISTGLSIDTIKENYQILIHYQSIFYRGSLQFKDFVMSEGGRIHFAEVKVIFEIIQIMLVFSSITSILLLIDNYKNREFRFLKLTAILTVIVPLVIGAIASIDFNQAFIMFHKIVFSNDYWIFDPTIDPIIKILPETFFMHALMMIIAIVILLSCVCLLLYHFLKKQYIQQYIA